MFRAVEEASRRDDDDDDDGICTPASRGTMRWHAAVVRPRHEDEAPPCRRALATSRHSNMTEGVDGV